MSSPDGGRGCRGSAAAFALVLKPGNPFPTCWWVIGQTRALTGTCAGGSDGGGQWRAPRPCWNYFKCYIWKLSFLSGLKNKLLIRWFFSERPTPKCRSRGGRRHSACWALGLWASTWNQQVAACYFARLEWKEPSVKLSRPKKRSKASTDTFIFDFLKHLV